MLTCLLAALASCGPCLSAALTVSDAFAPGRRRDTLLAAQPRPAPAAAPGGDQQVQVPPLPPQQSLVDVRSGRAAAGRSTAGGHSWAKTELGMVHYRLCNPEALASRTLVVLVPGITLPGVRKMSSMAEALASRGLPVLVFDLLGRGLSDRPPARYDEALFDRCVVGLLDALGLSGRPVDLLGYSMGGMIVQEVAVRHPELVRRMVLCAPAGTDLDEVPAPRRFGALRYAVSLMTSAVEGGESSWLAYYTAQYQRFKAYGMPEEKFEDFMAKIVDDAAVEFNGFAYSVGSTLADYVAMGAVDLHERRLRQFGSLGKPTIAIWGTADTDEPYSNHKNLLRYVPHCVLHSFANETHDFLMDEENLWIARGTMADFLLAP